MARETLDNQIPWPTSLFSYEIVTEGAATSQDNSVISFSARLPALVRGNSRFLAGLKTQAIGEALGRISRDIRGSFERVSRVKTSGQDLEALVSKLWLESLWHLCEHQAGKVRTSMTPESPKVSGRRTSG